ncbi:MAG: transposase, partial [Muribaculaceae bacterium]|nr:transposase [Muribaculaceae bacterium]
YHKRAFAHNYRAPFIYHIILKKQPGFMRFGEIKGDARKAPGELGCAYIAENSLGRIIAKAILGIQRQFQILQIYQFVVMPDHVHILLRVKDWSEKHLDFYVETLKANIGNAYSKEIQKEVAVIDMFLPGYCDKPLLLNRNLDGLFRYIRENPHRLAMRRQFPHFFQSFPLVSPAPRPSPALFAFK